MENTRFKINTPPIIQETLDGEVIMVNLDKGDYYSIQGTGVIIWSLIEKGYRINELVATIEDCYGTNPEEIKTTIFDFLERLKAECIIIENTSETAIEQIELLSSDAPYEPPVLEQYTDMRDLLLLDPIHEVDQTGWPNQPQNESQELKESE